MSTTGAQIDARMGWLYPEEHGDSVPAKVDAITGVVVACGELPDDILRPAVRLRIEAEEEVYPLCHEQRGGATLFFLEDSVLRDFLLDYEIAARRNAVTDRG